MGQMSRHPCRGGIAPRVPKSQQGLCHTGGGSSPWPSSPEPTSAGHSGCPPRAPAPAPSLRGVLRTSTLPVSASRQGEPRILVPTSPSPHPNFQSTGLRVPAGGASSARMVRLNEPAFPRRGRNPADPVAIGTSGSPILGSSAPCLVGTSRTCTCMFHEGSGCALLYPSGPRSSVFAPQAQRAHGRIPTVLPGNQEPLA